MFGPIPTHLRLRSLLPTLCLRCKGYRIRLELCPATLTVGGRGRGQGVRKRGGEGGGGEPRDREASSNTDLPTPSAETAHSKTISIRK